ncbi:MAG: hypothetical protein KC635_19760 [Myxococcales bacterium]|nr:hypothetical protein [Myxococcales bacterium]MCB9735199.1 hypothetical protein [Deltaproteobacteria bacterium]
MRHIEIALLAVLLSVPAMSCKSSRSGPVLAGAWRTSPEDLPYAGKTPRIRTVSYNLMLTSEEGAPLDGTGSFSPFFSSDDYQHVQKEDQPATAFAWTLADGKLTMTLKGEPGGTCVGEVPDAGGAITVKVAGCAPLEANVGADVVTFARRE